MSLPSSPFTSGASLEQDFADGLAAMLQSRRGLGVYILVLANAAYDARLGTRLAAALAARHGEHAAAITAALRHGDRLDEPDDDLLVFLKLHTIGLDHLGSTEHRRAGPWALTFNPIRALRPPRVSSMRFSGLRCPFDAAGFHFNRGFLASEIFWQGELGGRPARMLYNKFPFARLHGLLVPEPLRELPQYLSPELHRWAWEVCEQAGVPGLCLAYNSYGAGASVNHLHFQSFVLNHPLPLQDARFVHNGGREAYPLPCRRFSDPDQAWAEIDRLHQTETPYNLIYGKACLHLVARVPQDSDKLGIESRAYGWSEMAGALTLFSRDAFETMAAAEFEALLGRFACSPPV